MAASDSSCWLAAELRQALQEQCALASCPLVTSCSYALCARSCSYSDGPPEDPLHTGSKLRCKLLAVMWPLSTPDHPIRAMATRSGFDPWPQKLLPSACPALATSFLMAPAADLCSEVKFCRLELVSGRAAAIGQHQTGAAGCHGALDTNEAQKL